MTITQDTHVTATEKKHLKAFLESGHTQAKVNTKFYEILKGTARGEAMEYKIKITTPYRKDNGEKATRSNVITLVYNRK